MGRLGLGCCFVTQTTSFKAAAEGADGGAEGPAEGDAERLNSPEDVLGLLPDSTEPQDAGLRGLKAPQHPAQQPVASKASAPWTDGLGPCGDIAAYTGEPSVPEQPAGPAWSPGPEQPAGPACSPDIAPAVMPAPQPSTLDAVAAALGLAGSPSGCRDHAAIRSTSMPCFSDSAVCAPPGRLQSDCAHGSASMLEHQLSLEFQVAQALGTLAVTCMHPAPASPCHGPGVLNGVGSHSQRLHSPQHSSSSLTPDPEVAKRFSVCGAMAPTLDTICESSSQVSMATDGTGKPGAAHCASQAPAADASTAEAGLAAAADGCLPVAAGDSTPPEQGTAQQGSMLDEVLALLGDKPPIDCGRSQSAAGAGQAGKDTTLQDLLALLAGAPPSAQPDPAAYTEAAAAVDLGTAVAALLDEGTGVVADAAGQARPPLPATLVGRLASVHSEEESCTAISAAAGGPQEWGIYTCVQADATKNGCQPVQPAEPAASPSLCATSKPPPSAPEQPPPPGTSRSSAKSPSGATWTRPPWAEEEAASGGALPAMYARAMRQRREAEKRYARLREQQELEELEGCTFHPHLATAPSRPGSAPLARSPSSPGAALGPRRSRSRGGGYDEEAASKLYARHRAQHLKAQQRHERVRKQKEEGELEGCTFKPSINPKSARMFQDTGVWYPGAGKGSAVIAAPHASSSEPGRGSLDEAVRQQVQLLHQAGLNASAAARMLSGRQQPSGAGCRQGGEISADGEQLAGSADSSTTSAHRPAVNVVDGLDQRLAGVEMGGAMSMAASPKACSAQAESTLPADGAAQAQKGQQALWRCQSLPGVGKFERLSSPVKASQRLYAHARNLQERQRLAAAQAQQREVREALAAAPKPKPFPREQFTRGPSPPLSHRSPSHSRPGSAAASPRKAERDRCSQRGGSAGAAAYWERFGLEPHQDFDAFLTRQQRFAQELEERLERDRQLAAAQPAGSLLSPGSHRILQHKQKVATAAAAEHQSAGPSSPRIVAVRFARGLAGMMELAAGPNGMHSSEGEAWSECGQDGSQEALAMGPKRATQVPAYQANCTFRPAISARAQAKPAHSAEELHAEWEARQQKLATKQVEAEQAKLAACTFKPEIMPAGGPRNKYASTPPRMNLKEMGRHLEEEQKRRAARELAAAAAAREREERELAECTFQPYLFSRAPKHPKKHPQAPNINSSDTCTASADVTTDADTDAAGSSDVLSQVQVLLGEGATPLPGDAIATAPVSFRRYLEQVLQELRGLQEEGLGTANG